jgi:hypothetical protein
MKIKQMNEEPPDLVAELEKVSADAEKTFGSLSAEQLNWKPNAEIWSSLSRLFAQKISRKLNWRQRHEKSQLIVSVNNYFNLWR